MITRTILALAVLASVPATTGAGEIQDMAREAEAKASAGQHIEAVEILRRAIGSLAAKGPLMLRQVQFVAKRPKAFGMYQPRDGNVFRPGEPLLVYAEPVGLGWKTADGVHHANVETDFEIRTTGGKILGGQKSFGRFGFVSRDQNQEIMTILTIRVSGVRAGKYVLGATYRDQVTGKSATLELPFEIK